MVTWLGSEDSLLNKDSGISWPVPVTLKNVADHKEPLVQEYHRAGTIDQQRMRGTGAVQFQCQNCSNQQGGFMASFSRAMKKLFFGSSNGN